MLNDFAEERLLIYANLPLPANIEILKRNTQQVGTMNISEGFRARCQRPGVPDTLEISRDVHHGNELTRAKSQFSASNRAAVLAIQLA